MFTQTSSERHYTCIFDREELFIVRAMWNHSPHIISESAQLLALCHTLPLWPEAFWLESISESTSKKWASECAGLHRACGTVQAAFLISHVCSIVYENNLRSLVIDRMYCPESFYLAFPASKHLTPLEVTIKLMQGESGRWCSLPSHLCPFLSVIISPAESPNLGSSSRPAAEHANGYLLCLSHTV